MADKSIIATFTPEVWIDNLAADAGDSIDFDATAIVLGMPLSGIQKIEDFGESADVLADKLPARLSHGGPFRIEVVDSILEYFGVENLTDITAEMLRLEIEAYGADCIEYERVRTFEGSMLAQAILDGEVVAIEGYSLDHIDKDCIEVIAKSDFSILDVDPDEVVIELLYEKDFLTKQKEITFKDLLSATNAGGKWEIGALTNATVMISKPFNVNAVHAAKPKP